jgi:hypothetical protein
MTYYLGNDIADRSPGRAAMSTNDERGMRQLSSNAWLRYGPKGFFGSIDAGMLLAVGDRVSFVTKKGTIFQADLSEIKVKWPGCWAGFAVNLATGGKVYRLSLARPRGGEEFDKTAGENLSRAVRETLGDLVWDGFYGISAYGDAKKGRASGKHWKAYFAAGTANHPA